MSDILLVDADIIAFQVAAVSQQSYLFEPEELPVVAIDPWAEVVPRIHRAIDKLKDALNTEHVIICLSCPTEENWRLKVLPTYKSNRDYLNRPAHLAGVKNYLAANYPSYRRPTLEADDIMGILSTMPGLPKSLLAEHPEFTKWTRKIIVSEDKDMKTIPGWLYNPAKDSKPKLIGDATADWWHLYQTICGDTTDGYKGCLGAGPTTAAEILNDPFICEPYTHVFKRGPRKGLEETRWRYRPVAGEETLWDCVVSLFKRHGHSEEDALAQARVSRICRFKDYDFNKKEVILWTPH